MSIKAVPTYLLGLKPLARDVHPYRFENVIGIPILHIRIPYT